MATQEQVRALHRAHPDWDDITIADVLDCEDAYVRAAARRMQIKLPPRLKRATIGQIMRGPNGERLVVQLAEGA